jgi:prevent-host-death family protein
VKRSHLGGAAGASAVLASPGGSRNRGPSAFNRRVHEPVRFADHLGSDVISASPSASHRWTDRIGSDVNQGESSGMKDWVNIFRSSLGANEARANFSEVIGRVAYGNEWIALNRRGKTIAMMVPLSALELVNTLARKVETAEITTVEARNNLSDVISRAAFGNEAILLTRRGRRVAGIVSIDYLERLAQFYNVPGGRTQPLDSVLQEDQGRSSDEAAGISPIKRENFSDRNH